MLLEGIMCVLFDFGGTLFYMSPSSEELFQKFLKTEGYTRNLEDIKIGTEKANLYYERTILPRKKKENRELTSEEEWIEYDTVVLKCLGIDEPEIVTRVQEKWNQYMDAPTFKNKPFLETISVLNQLKARGINLGLISNTENDLREELEHYGILKLFSVVLLSYEEKSRKPESIMFLKALEELQIKPEECLYVGDDWNADIQGAKNVGIGPVWIQRDTQSYVKQSTIRDVIIIHSLTEILS